QMDEKKELQELLERIRNGNPSKLDLKRYADWCDQFQRSPEEIADFPEIKREMSVRIREQIDSYPRYRTLRRWSYVAAGILLFLAGWFGWRSVESVSSNRETAAINQPVDILPGGNRATLQLDNGQQFDLNKEQAGIVMEDGSVSYADG